ncbi:putative oxidoreductase CzcO [Candidatus Ornithobacterium hominis]|uniref:YpdA family putative bacillithiol disulfide reductase n=1 Tax=Candidatus Ornithobacterium hominis TaxID=2497989 RepID=UPI0024BC8632|nr:YpdA family putative bacillithiol disulfide reductase [Candidatus Ornithobacterium hominis]CAI9429167.1 putative oxidoreductase CzcO [Candidatus Ornithobacterium hominis]
MKQVYDIIIVGAGPMGIAIGIEAQKNKLSYLILEKGTLVNSIFNFPKNMTFFSTSQKLEIGEIPFVSINEKPKRTEALEYYRRVVEHLNLHLHLYEKVESIEKKEDLFQVKTAKGNYTAKNIAIATGFYDQPNRLNIPGEELPKVKHYYDEPYAYINQNVVVVGAGNSATQVALELHQAGVNVTMVVRDNKIEPNVKYWIKPNIENRIENQEIPTYFNSELAEINPKSVKISTPQGLIEIKNDFVLAMIGYHPDFEFLNKIGVTCDSNKFNRPNFSPDTHETEIENLYVAGVVCGGNHTSTYFIENSIEHATAIVNSILSKV